MQVVVIGGGAAGFFGAISCAQVNPDAEVLILEASRNVLTKVKISGGGRCNVTHACFDPAQLVQNYPRGYRALRGAMSRFQPRDTVAWFEQHGVSLKAEADGRMFPVTNESQTIIDCLLRVAKRYGIKIQTGVSARSVTRAGDEQFQVISKKKTAFLLRSPAHHNWQPSIGLSPSRSVRPRFRITCSVAVYVPNA